MHRPRQGGGYLDIIVRPRGFAEVINRLPGRHKSMIASFIQPGWYFRWAIGRADDGLLKRHFLVSPPMPAEYQEWSKGEGKGMVVN